MSEFYDVVIIGGGVAGSSVAYHLSADPDFKGRIAVVERDPTYAAASSSLSASGVRQQFGTEPNIRMSAYSIEFLRQVRTLLAVDGHDADIALREQGYLILGTPEDHASFEAKVAAQHACGIRTELLSPGQIADRFPWVNVDGVGIGSFGPEKEGWFDGPGLLQAYRRKARSQGVTYVAGVVAALEMAGASRVAGVTLADGTTLRCGTVVNAAGCWSAGIARMAGIELPVVPRKRCIFVLDSPERIPHSPLILDTTGFFFRPEGQLYLAGITPLTENAPDDYSLDVDHDLFDDLLWPALAHRIPQFEQLKMLRAWAGFYEYNTFDHSGIVGRHPDVTNFLLVCGFSGHGMMHSPAAGAGARDLIIHDEFRSVDLSAFAFERIAARRPIEEVVYG